MPSQLPTDITETCDGFFYCMGLYLKDVTGGLFWAGALLAFAVVLFVASSPFGRARAFGFAAMVGLLGAIWLAVLQFITWWVASVFILSGVVGFVVLIMNER